MSSLEARDDPTGAAQRGGLILFGAEKGPGAAPIHQTDNGGAGAPFRHRPGQYVFGRRFRRMPGWPWPRMLYSVGCSALTRLTPSIIELGRQTPNSFAGH